MNEPYFFADTLFSKGEKSDLPRFSRALADAESNYFYKNHDGEPAYVRGHMQVWILYIESPNLFFDFISLKPASASAPK